MTEDKEKQIEEVGYAIGYVLGALFWIGLVAVAYYLGKRAGAAAPK